MVSTDPGVVERIGRDRGAEPHVVEQNAEDVGARKSAHEEFNGTLPSPESFTASLTARIGEWARSLTGEPDEMHLKRLIEEAVHIIPGTDYASLSVLGRDRRIRSHAPSDDIPKILDDVQSELQAGPCYDSIREERVIRVADLRETTPWPAFASRAVDEGVKSMLAFQLFVETDNLGALNLYSTRIDAFDSDAVNIAAGVAAHASLALAVTQKQGQLFEAVQSRDLIGQAKGILMERHKIDESMAFALLTESSSRTNRKLRDIAAELARTGKLPGI